MSTFPLEDLKTFLQKEIENIIFSKVDFDESLIKSKLLDSISVIDLAVAIEEKTGIEIAAQEINEENFDTIHKLLLFIQRKM